MVDYVFETIDGFAVFLHTKHNHTSRTSFSPYSYTFAKSHKQITASQSNRYKYKRKTTIYSGFSNWLR